MIHAVTAILVCDDEVFVIHRQPHLRAFAGYLAFPGGKIDAEDYQVKLQHRLLLEHEPAHISALHRELSEELAYDLNNALKAESVLDISLFGTAITPEFERIRFSAHYYKIVLKHKPSFRFEENEIRHGEWRKASQLAEQYRCGQALMVVPMRNTLFALADDITRTSASSFNVKIPEGQLACIELVDGLRTIPVPSRTLPPATRTNSLLLGDEGERQILVDPSPESKAVYAQLMNTLMMRRVDAVLISHHHPDHHERAVDVAHEKGVPIMLTRRTHAYLQALHGGNYFREVEIEYIAEGEAISCWKGQPIRVYELPGHDDGMVGLAPDNLAWFFIADLAQSNGSIVIPEEGGDLNLYMDSLQRVIDLNPKVILPSHGIPSGGTMLLEKTLSHRVDRENQIRPYYEQGATVDEIVCCVYPELNEQLKSLAAQTVKQHIKKLDQDRGIEIG